MARTAGQRPAVFFAGGMTRFVPPAIMLPQNAGLTPPAFAKIRGVLQAKNCARVRNLRLIRMELRVFCDRGMGNRRYSHEKRYRPLGIKMADLGRDSPFRGTRLPALGDAGEVQQFLAAIVESSDDAILSKDLQGIITRWNGGCVRLFGYTADEAIGRPAAMLHPADRHDEEAMILTRLRLGEKIDHYETVRQRKDGSLVDSSLSVCPIKNQHGTIVGASKVARDITAQKRAIEQQELLLGEMRHRVKNLSTVIEAL